MNRDVVDESLLEAIRYLGQAEARGPNDRIIRHLPHPVQSSIPELKELGLVAVEYTEASRDIHRSEAATAATVLIPGLPEGAFDEVTLTDRARTLIADRDGDPGSVDRDQHMDSRGGSSSSTAPGMPPVRDGGAALLEPITVSEYSGIERLLAELRDAYLDGGMNEEHRTRLYELTLLIAHTYRETDALRTRRLELWATTRAVLKWAWADLPEGALKWSAIVWILDSIGWVELADSIRGAIGH